MAKIYGALEVAQLEWFTDAGKPAASSYIYRVIYVSDLKQVMVSDGSNWIPFLNTSTNQTVNGNITFAGQQIFNGLHRLSVTTDSSSTGAVTALNNVTPVIEFTAAVTSISGIVNSASGATVMLVNRTGGTIAVLDEDTGATAANRIRTGTGAQISLANNASIILTYVGDNRWHIVGGSGSGSGSAGINYITNGSAEADTLGWAVYAESDAVTFQDTGDTVTLNSHGLSNGNQISFTSIVSTTGISTNTLYFVINATTNTFQVATTATGSALPLTTNGSGTMVRFAPKVGTGGSANVTITRTTTTPLVGTASFLLAKDAANRQGQGWSYDFTIDLTNRAKVLQISFDYLVNSGTFVAGATGSNSDVTVWIYDITNAVLIQPSNIKLFSNNGSITDKFQASFQTASNSSSYRLILHVASTSASAYTLEVDSVSVSPSDYVFGTPVTDWQSYTPTITHDSGGMTNAVTTARYRRVGDSIHVNGIITFSSTSATFSGLRVSIPSGLSIDNNKRLSSRLGSGLALDASVQNYNLSITYNNSNSVYIYVENSTTAYVTENNIQNTVPFTFGSGDTISFEFFAPITGWSSSVQTSDSADTRVVAASIQATAANYTLPNAGDIVWNSSIFDTHSGFNGTTSYTIPVSGYYQIGMDGLNTSAATYFYVYKNGTKLTTAQGTIAYATNTTVGNGYLVDRFNAGDVLTIRTNSTGTTTLYYGPDYRATLSITRITGPSAIAATETVAAAYYCSTAQVTSITSPINYDSKEYDTHGAVTTGASWKFTVPTSGKYLVTAVFYSSTASVTSASLYKNGTRTKVLGATNSTTYDHVALTTQISLVAGDYIDIRPTNQGNTNSGSTPLITSAIQITRIGN